MKHNGFTLIELLAVIIVLSIIALIAIPSVNNIVKNAKKDSFKQTVQNVIDSANNYISTKLIKGDVTFPVEFTCDGSVCRSGEDILEMEGSAPKKGSIVVENIGNIYAVNLYDGTFCFSGGKYNLRESDCYDSKEEANPEYNPENPNTDNPQTDPEPTPDPAIEQYGLFDSNNNLIVSWDDLVNVYGLDISKDYTGVYYNAQGNGVKVFTDNNFTGFLKIAPGVTKIGALVFRNFSKLTGVYIPASVIEIGEEAFNKNSSSVFTKAIFEDPNNWYYTYDGEEKAISGLSDSSGAATKLTKATSSRHYATCKWYKK